MQKIASLILSTYAALVIYSNAFFVKQLTIINSESQLFWNHLAIFVIIMLPIYFLMNKIVSPNEGRGGMRILRLILLALVFLGLVLSVLYHVIPMDGIYNLPPSVDKFFVSDTAYTLWLIAPLLALFI